MTLSAEEESAITTKVHNELSCVEEGTYDIILTEMDVILALACISYLFDWTNHMKKTIFPWKGLLLNRVDNLDINL